MGSKPIGSFYVQLGLNTENFRKNLELAQRDLRAAFGTAAIHASEVLAASIGAIGAAMAAIGVKAVKMAADLERQQVALTRLLGSAEAATQRILELQKFAAVSGMGFDQLVDYQKRMMAVGFSAQETAYLLERMADASGALGLSGVGLDRLIKAFGDVKAKGTLQTQEIKQFAEAGLPVWDMLGKAMGKTREELVKMVEGRQISSAAFFNAMSDEMERRFGGMMTEMANTVSGAWNKLENAVTITMQKIGKYINDNAYIKDFLQGTANLVTNLTNVIESKGLSNLIDAFAEQFPIISDAIYTLSVNLASLLLPALSSVGNFLTLMLAPLAGIYIKMLLIGLAAKDMVNGFVEGQSFIFEAFDYWDIFHDLLIKKIALWVQQGVDWVNDNVIAGIARLGNDIVNYVAKIWNAVIKKLGSLLSNKPILANGLDELADVFKFFGDADTSKKLIDLSWNFRKGQNPLAGLMADENILYFDEIVPDGESAKVVELKNGIRDLEDALDESKDNIERHKDEFMEALAAEVDKTEELKDAFVNLTKAGDDFQKAVRPIFGGGATGTSSGDITAEGLARKGIKGSGDKGLFGPMAPALMTDGMPVDELLPLISGDANALLQGSIGMAGLPGMGTNLAAELMQITESFKEVNKETKNAQKSWLDYKQDVALTAVDTFNEVLWASGNFFENLGEGLKKLGQQILQQITQFLLLRAIFDAFNLGSINQFFPYADVFNGKMNDGVVQNGKLISTHPDDYIIATKDPGSLGGKANVVVNVNNNSQSQVSTNSYFDGTREIIDIFIDGFSHNVNGVRDMVRSS